MSKQEKNIMRLKKIYFELDVSSLMNILKALLLVLSVCLLGTTILVMPITHSSLVTICLLVGGLGVLTAAT
jgi:hypothetical protein